MKLPGSYIFGGSRGHNPRRKTIENFVDYGRLNPYNTLMKSDIRRGISHLLGVSLLDPRGYVCDYLYLYEVREGSKSFGIQSRLVQLVQHFVDIVVQCLVRFPNPLADFFSSQAGTLSVQCLPLSPASFSPSTRTSRSKWRRV